MPLFLTGYLDQRPIRFSLTEGRHILGRSLDCQFCIDHPGVSRRHLELVVSGETVLVTDLNSHNGTSVNDVRIEAPTSIVAGDRVRMAEVALRLTDDDHFTDNLYAPETDALARTGLLWDDIRRSRKPDSGEHHDRFQVLLDAGELLAVNRPLGELFELILDLVERTFKPQRILLLLTEEDEELTVEARRIQGTGRGDRLMLSRTMVNKVMTEKVAFVTANALLDSRFNEQESIIAQGIHSAMVAPLFDNETVIGLLYADTADLGTSYSEDDLRTFGILANLSAVKITQARIAALREEQHRLKCDVEAAREILSQILPETVTQVEGFDLHAFWKPCFTVGGDLYDSQLLPDGRLAFLFGDVTGKGLGAALLVSHVMPIVRLLSEELWHPERLISRLNRDLWRSTDSVHFVTLFFGVLDPTNGKIVYVNAGHNPPLHLNRDGRVDALDSTGMAAGMFERSEYSVGELILEPGEVLALYTDGVTEAEDPDGEAFEQERLAEILVRERHRSPEEMAGRVMDELCRFHGGDCFEDDVTMMLIRRQSG
jgi:sigma-B regulation protein RsbU (phosphoserine phosphatase)